jgi:organic radical activating enzyme
MTDQIMLPVMEHFYTIQGEGFHQGKAAYFIRLAGCDVGCVWCDVKESWDRNIHPEYSISEIVDWVKSSMKEGIVVITGGEPLMHDLNSLTSVLKNEGYAIHLETSGTQKLTGDIDWICLSPKKFKAPLEEAFETADELKVIVYHKSDLEWALQLKSKTKLSCKLYLQPEWSKSAEITPSIVDFVKSNPEWILSIQIHKYIQVP